MTWRLKIVTFVLVLAGAVAVPATGSADGIRGCDDPTDTSCCNLIESLRGCRN